MSDSGSGPKLGRGGSSFWRGRGNWRGKGNWKGRGNWRGRGNWSGRGGYNKTNNNNNQGNYEQDTPNYGNQCSSQESYTTPREPTRQIAIDRLFTPIPGCYKAWKLYFPMEEYNTASPTVNKIKSFEKYIDKNKDLYIISEIEKRKAFNLDLKVLKKDEEFMDDWPDFEENLANQPDSSLNCLSLAMHQFVLSHMEKELQEENVVTEISLPMIKVRLINYEPVVQMKHLTANTYGKLVTIQGTVIRVGQIKLLCAWLAYSCARCAHVQCVAQVDGACTLPTSCLQTVCQSRTFRPLYSSPYTQTVNWQTVKLQEILADDQRDRGRVPRTVECELNDELVDCCSPGDVVSITGIVKIRSSDESSYRKSKAPSVYLIYIEGKSVLNTKNYSSGPKQSNDVEFTTNDYYAIQEIQANPQLFRLAVNSLCPSIYGHEMVKAGLLLGLLGGAGGGCKRGDSHVLVVGDPGLGKSQMLQACSLIAPRGVYVCGNTSTSSGLTVTLTREGGGNFALEAGALVLADQGCCCIDEFDKMSSQHQALLEAMEQQVISITKAGIICTLPARTSILAAANPVGGHYNRAKTVSENLRLGSALLSRFDLVFILQDRPDEYLDTLLSEHVMSLYSHLKVASTADDTSSFVGNMSCTEPDILNPNVPLSKRLKLCPGEDISPISPVLLRKYIAYAKKYIPSPELSPEAGSVLQNFYLELRRQHQTLDATPITTRQLESLIRLTQARAKLELREVATALDAIEVVELMRWSMVDTFTTDVGGLDFQRSQHGSGMSSRNQAKRFVSLLQRQADHKGSSMFSVDEMKETAARNNIVVNDFFAFLSSLNNHGFLIKKGKNQYQLLSVDY